MILYGYISLTTYIESSTHFARIEFLALEDVTPGVKELYGARTQQT